MDFELCLRHAHIEPVTILNKLGLNQDAFIDTDDASWGAIKSIYDGR